MKIIISPAKKMNVDNDDFISRDIPVFMNKTEMLHKSLKSLSYDELKKVLACNDDIATLNYNRYKDMNLEHNLTPALFSYDGIQYKYMSPNSLSYDELEYLENHLRILSGLYGILKPYNGVVPYRIEMMAKFKTDYFKNLYDFWKDDLYNNLTRDDKVILNLASKEYSKCIEKYLNKDDTYITVIFGTLKDNKIKVKATEAKMARGLMVRYMAQNNIENIEDIKNFSDLGFKFSEEYSTEKEFVFLNNN